MVTRRALVWMWPWGQGMGLPGADPTQAAERQNALGRDPRLQWWDQAPHHERQQLHLMSPNVLSTWDLLGFSSESQRPEDN